MQAWVQKVGDARVGPPGLAPVQPWLLVVHRVEAVVEHEKVHPPRHEVPRVVPARPGIAIDMLQVVREHEPPERPQRRNAEGRRVDRRAPGVAVEPHRKRPGGGVHSEDDLVLGEASGVSLPAAFLRPPEEASGEGRLSDGGDEEEGHGCEERVLSREAPGDGRVSRAVHELVVILVMGRNPDKRRIAIEYRYPHREEAVGPAPHERGRVVVVVRDHAGAVGEVHRDRQQPPAQARVDILRDHGGRHEQECPRQRPRVRSMSKTHDLFPCRMRTVGY